MFSIACFWVTAQPLTQPVSARYLPLGTYSEKSLDIYATRSNAASLAYLPQSSAAIYAERRFGLSSLNGFSFSAGILTKKSAFALHGNYFGYSLFSQSQLSLAYGRPISKKVAVGVQFNYYSLRQGNGYGNASSVNASVGTMIHITDKLNAGINIYNPTGSKWSKADDEKIPAQFTFGLGYDVSDKVYISAEIVKEENLPVSVNAGLQYQLNKQFFARAGASTATSSYFASVGFQLDAFRADVAASYQSPLGISPGIMLLFNLGKKKMADTEPAAEKF